MLNWIYYLILLLVSLVGLFLNILGLPGLWLMVGAMALFGWVTKWDLYVGWQSIVALTVMGLVAETTEFLAGAAGSKAAGGRKRGMVGGIVGALVGGIVISFVIPIPVVGTIVGAILGAFIGAGLMELPGKDVSHAMRVGVGAAKGRFAGIVIKMGIGIAMLILIMIAALPI